MRIIAGKYKKSNLFTLQGMQTRPTLDKTKEAIFSSMGNYLTDYVTLDLFGGSGALSLEALSRGAKKAYLFELNKDALEIIKKNKTKLRIENELEIIQGDYKLLLNKFKNNKFDVIFIDPPFRMKVIDEIITFIVDNNMINEDGYIMAEYPVEDIVKKEYAGFNIKLCRRYSSSEVLILEKE